MSTFIVLAGSAVLFVVFVVIPACWLTSVRRERWAKAYWSELAPPATEDPGEWTGPLHTGGTGAEKRMRRYFHDHGQILVNRASKQTRRVAAALDAHRPAGWMLRHRLRPMRRAVFTAPVAEASLEPLPEPPAHLDKALMGHNFDEWPPVDGPELQPAPLAGLWGQGLIDASGLGFLVSSSILPPAPDDGGASPIGDALTAEMGIVPAPRDGTGEGDSLAWIDAWLASPLPGDEPVQVTSALYPDWQPDDSGIMRAIRGEAV